MEKIVKYGIASLVGNLVKDVPVIIPHLVWHMPKTSHWDFAYHIATGHVKHGMSDDLLGLLVEFPFGLMVGTIIYYALDKINPKVDLATGAFLGFISWFAIRSMVFLAQAAELQHGDIWTSTINKEARKEKGEEVVAISLSLSLPISI